LQIQSLSCLYTIDELLVGYVRDHKPDLAHHLRYLPDPTDLPLNFGVGELRKRYNIPVNAKVILVYGVIDERKGLFLLLDALALEQELFEWHALVVGRQSVSVRAALTSTRWDNIKKVNRIHSIDDFVTDEVEQDVLGLCDAVWVAYTEHYQMSGVLVKAGMHRKPVVACEEGLIGWYARYKGVGVIVNHRTSSILNALKALSVIAQAASIGEHGYVQFNCHTWEKCKRILTAKAYTS